MPRFSKKANLVKELEFVIQVRTLKAYLQFYLDAEDRFEDELASMLRTFSNFGYSIDASEYQDARLVCHVTGNLFVSSFACFIH